MRVRKYYLDFLKTIGLLFVILAHMGPPRAVIFFRCFDVPFLVIISGILANDSYSEEGGYLLYLFKRIKRLAMPGWLFLLFYFFVLRLDGYVYSLRYYIDSFMFTRLGISYVWIIMVYIYCAMAVPVIKKLFEKSVCLGWTIIISLLLLYLLAFHYGIGDENTAIYYIISYGFLTTLGLRYDRMRQKQKIMVSVISLFIFIVMLFIYRAKTGILQLPTIEKYPPQTYFLSYSVGVSFIYLLLFENLNLSIYKNKFVLFISQHSLWIYLWHIFFIWLYDYTSLPGFYLFKWIVIALFSIFTSFVQERFFLLIERKTKHPIPKFLYK